MFWRFLFVVLSSFIFTARVFADVFSNLASPDEFGVISSSIHGKDKNGYRFNNVHPGIGFSGKINSSQALRWQAGYLAKDSYGCEAWYGGANWFPVRNNAKTAFVGVAFLGAKKCLGPDTGEQFIVVPLPAFRFMPGKHTIVEGVFAPQVGDGTVPFIAINLRHAIR